MKKLVCISMLLMVFYALKAQQCCNFSPLGLIGGPDPDPHTGFGVAIADIDGDGDGDVAFHSAYENTYIYKNNNGVFQLSQTFTYNNDDNWQYGLNFADIDGDGDMDLVTTPQWSSAKMFVYKNNGSGTFSLWQQLSTNLGAYNKDMGDIDGDGDIDIVIVTAGSGYPPLKVYKNNGNGTFSLYNSFNGEGGRTVVLADIDNDGDKDAIVATMYYGTGVRIYKNDGSGNFTMDSQELYINNETYHSIAVADFNNDGKLDIAAGTGGFYIHIFKNLGNGLFTFIRELRWENAWVSYYMQLRAVDMDGDGRRDLVASAYSGGVTVWRSINNDFEFSPCYRSTLANYGHGMDIGDLNNDGKIDIIGSVANNGIGYAFLNNGGLSGQPASASNTSPVCEGGSVQLLAQPSGASYQWSGPDNYYNGQQNPTINYITSSQQGVYTVLVSNTLCYNVATTFVSLYATPIVNAGNDQSINYNTSTQLNGSVSGGSGNYTYQWTPANLLNNPNILNPTTVNLTQSTSFTLLATDNSTGCSASDDVLITVTGTALSASIHAPGNSICYGSNMQLTALGTGGTGNYTYTWASDPTGFSSTDQIVTVNPLTTTTYYVTIDDGVTSATASIQIIVNALPSVTITTGSPYCPYDIIQLSTGTFQAYNWSGPNNFSSNIQNPTVGQLGAGYYTFYVTVTDQNGCTNTTSASVVVYNQPTAQATTQPDSLNLYFTNQADFYGINTGGITTWSWLIDNQSFTTQNVTYTFNQTGTYNIELIVGNSNGCYDTLTFDYVVYNLALPLSLQIQASTTDICIGQSAQLQAIVTGGTGLYTYNWASSPAGFSSFNATVTVNPSVSTLYYVTVSDGYATQVDSIFIEVHNLPNVTAWSNSPYCTYDVIQLHASDAYSYQWTGSNGFSSTEQNPVVGNLPAGNYQYTVVVNDIYGCTNSVTIQVTVYNQPVAQLFFLPDSLDLSISQIANFYGINVGGTITSWLWTINNQTFTTQNVAYTFNQTGTYPVELIVQNAQGCYDTTVVNYLVYNSTIIPSLSNLKNNLIIYPNPANQYLCIESDNTIREIKICDIAGKIIESFITNDNVLTIDLTKFSSGFYLIKCITEAQEENIKMIIKE